MTKSNNEWGPDVGQECEISNCGNPFEWCVIRYLGEQLIVVDHKSHIDQHYHVGSFVLRPIKTEAEKRREVDLQDLETIITAMRPDTRMISRAIIDAGWIKPKPLTDDVIRKMSMMDDSNCDRTYARRAERYIRGELDL